MANTLRVADITTYLAETGWRRAPRDWNGAGIWSHPGDFEILVPARDGLGDARARVDEILRCLSVLEDRPVREIAEEIAHPDLDTQYVRTFPAGHAVGYTSVAAGFQTVQGVRDLLAIATRTVMQGPHFTFAGRSPGAVSDLLKIAEFGPSRAGSYVVEVRLSATIALPGDLSGRAVLGQMHEAVAAAQTAVSANRPAAFGDAVIAGVSANLCRALSDLSGIGQEQPFEIGFRWGRAVPVEVGARVLRFPAGSGALLQAAAEYLRHLDASGQATVSGVIETLHNGAGSDERWRISVRGELQTTSGPARRRKVWVRLPNETTYERASAAHHERRLVRIAGELSSTSGRIELVPAEGFDVID
ncbi:hypothetical protein RB614_03210 [Phytohabitans sp. ZYX-F-186]|uniref:Uncharacterized protein n=1 Tax=Phytohabitans maris TaxID=3071409 RepID=A0ABU0Z8Y5_9ACTN|nr:hypothetical protein [Phytohabitans sp. ZYX-F-186]MDQ7903521.1 hypothetical protein [Phytohabitans sp. ZYX-F-186]